MSDDTEPRERPPVTHRRVYSYHERARAPQNLPLTVPHAFQPGDLPDGTPVDALRSDAPDSREPAQSRQPARSRKRSRAPRKAAGKPAAAKKG